MKRKGTYYYRKIWNSYYPNDKVVAGDGYCIHHIDYDFNNNLKENLQKMLYGEHNTLHHKNRFSGKKHRMYGKHCSEDVKKKISKSLTGRKLPDKHKKKIAESMINNKNRKTWLENQ